MGKSGKGTVVIEVANGRLRLRWRVAGERYATALGLAEGVVNRKVAQMKAKQIEGDIATWEWGMQPHWRIVELNVWAELPGWVKVPPKQCPRPFTEEEMVLIPQVALYCWPFCSPRCWRMSSIRRFSVCNPRM
ncbi:Arm DNA-binding domain-containing protein [Gloeobacter kilaueensis]|uniref:Integrase family protein n=1 Tax=Gloeobacter kilaueensis (strain ATCC BAA-2537 / CCAP 1431/1 / ULC 316 / JS1) TaxID=1183438 RepID=U5QF87_GLOK1|nr:integrase family protein [Gloeobacter kilaueensis JS1]